jgi:mRNA interferase MazF
VICDTGDVAVVPFPFVEMAVSKMRPALVLSNRAFNEDNGHTLLAMITTAARSAWPSDIHLREPERAGLRKDCYVRWKIFTLPNTLLQRTVGALAPEDASLVQKASRVIFEAP